MKNLLNSFYVHTVYLFMCIGNEQRLSVFCAFYLNLISYNFSTLLLIEMKIWLMAYKRVEAINFGLSSHI